MIIKTKININLKQLIKFILMSLALLGICSPAIAAPSYEIKQSALNNDITIPHGVETPNMSRVVTFRMHAEVVKAGSDPDFQDSDTRLKNCIKLKNANIVWDNGNYTSDTINDFSQLTPKHGLSALTEFYGGTLRGVIVNDCKSDEDIELRVWVQSLDAETGVGTFLAWKAMDIHLDSAKKCWMAVPSNIDFGKVSPGGTATQTLTILNNTPSAGGYLEITSPDLISGGVLQLGGSDQLTVTTDSAHFVANHWNYTTASTPHQDDIPLTLKVSKNAQPGKYHSLLTATLSCP